MTSPAFLVRSLTASLMALIVLSGVNVEGAVPAAQAASITVTTFADEVAVNGQCSLREALLAANRNAPVDSCKAGRRADTIRLAAGRYELTLQGILEDAGETGDLDITGRLSIVGAGRDATVIAGDPTDRVFDVHASGALTLASLSVLGQSDLLHAPNPDEPGYFTHGRGGGIRNQGGELALVSATVTGRSYGHGGCRYCWDGEGGGIANEGGTLSITNSQVSGKAAWGGAVAIISGKAVINDSQFTGEAIEYGGTFLLYGAQTVMTRVMITGSRSQGQAVITGGPGGTLTIRNSELRDNWGGISNVGPGHLELYDTVIADNVATLTGPRGDNGPGAISNGGTAELIRVSVLNNAGGHGGAIANGGVLVIRDSTIAGNSGLPGAIDSSGDASSLTLINTTVSGNRALGDESPSAISMADGLIRSSTIVHNEGASEALWIASGRLANSVIADNVSTYGFPSPDCGSGIYESPGTFTSLGYNLIENGSNCVADGDDSTDIRGVDPLLGPLADNGGATLTHLPLPGSPLIDAGNPAKSSKADAACPARDQIGTKRPQDGDGDRKARCDVGAVERLAPRR